MTNTARKTTLRISNALATRARAQSAETGLAVSTIIRSAVDALIASSSSRNRVLEQKPLRDAIEKAHGGSTEKGEEIGIRLEDAERHAWTSFIGAAAPRRPSLSLLANNALHYLYRS